MATFQKILITTDGSGEAAPGLEAGLDLAQTLGVEPTVLYVIPDPYKQLLRSPASGFITPKVDEAEMREAAMKEAEGVLDLAEDVARAKGIVVHRKLEMGNPVATIIEVAKEFDLLVMATSGRGKVLYNMLGGTVQKVSRRSDTPMLMVKSGDRD